MSAMASILCTKAAHMSAKSRTICAKAARMRAKAAHMSAKTAHMIAKAPTLYAKAAHMRAKAPTLCAPVTDHRQRRAYERQGADHLRQRRSQAAHMSLETVSSSPPSSSSSQALHPSRPKASVLPALLPWYPDAAVLRSRSIAHHDSHCPTCCRPTNAHQCLLFFRALRPPPAQRCVDTFCARSLSLPNFYQPFKIIKN